MSDLEGAMLSDYLLLECTSRGNVADIYRARQNDARQYEVAVKVFRSAYAEREAFRAYFLHEAEKIGQFDHPHILPFIEYGEGEGLLYSVTPYVKSGSLDDLLKRVGGRFPAMQAQPMVQQLCDAVQYAHDHDVIHGNIKPRNIFVANDGRMLLADFGIARGYAEGQQAFSKMGWGVVQYAAPEQSLGLVRRASDIYALGAVFFRMLTGSPVFAGQTPVEVLLKHVRQAPPLARSLVPTISDAVDEVLQNALSKRAEDRYVTAAELSRAFTEAVLVAPVASPVARTISLAVYPLASDPQTPLPDSIGSIAAQPTAPLLSVTASEVNQTLVTALPAELMQQSAPHSSVLPEQHGLTSLPYMEPQQIASSSPDQAAPSEAMYWPQEPVEWSPLAPAQMQTGADNLPAHPADQPAQSGATYWPHEPVEWSPLAKVQTQTGADSISTHAADYLGSQQSFAQTPEPPQVGSEKRSWRKGRLLPVLVIVLLLLGLLAALLSSFLLPASTTHGTGLHASPAVAAQAYRVQESMGG